MTQAHAQVLPNYILTSIFSCKATLSTGADYMER